MGSSVLVVFIFVIFSVFSQNCICAEVDKPETGINVDDNTTFLLEVDEKINGMVDRKNQFNPVVHGGSIVDDAYFGKCLKFGEGGNNSIVVADGGKISFAGGSRWKHGFILKKMEHPMRGEL